MNQRVLFLAQLPPPVHGVTVMSRHIHDYLAGLSGITVVRKDFGAARNLADIGGRSPAKLLALGCAVLSLAGQAIGRRRYDLAYVTMAPWANAALRDAILAGLARTVSRRTLLHVHGEGLDDLLAGNSRRSRLIRRLIARCEVLAITSKTREVAMRSGIFNRVWSLPNFVADQGIAAPRKSDVLALGFLGNLDPRKGTLHFLSCLKVMKDKGLPVRGRIAGPDTGQLTRTELEVRARDEGLADVVEVVGGKFGAEKQAFLSDLHIFVYLTEHDHAPLVLLEAMSLGVVPITTNTGGIAEIVGPELARNVLPLTLTEAERTARVAEIVRGYASSPALHARDRLAARSRFLRSFTEQRFFEQLNAILADALEKDPLPAAG